MRYVGAAAFTATFLALAVALAVGVAGKRLAALDSEFAALIVGLSLLTGIVFYLRTAVAASVFGVIAATAIPVHLGFPSVTEWHIVALLLGVLLADVHRRHPSLSVIGLIATLALFAVFTHWSVAALQLLAWGFCWVTEHLRPVASSIARRAVSPIGPMLPGLTWLGVAYVTIVLLFAVAYRSVDVMSVHAPDRTRFEWVYSDNEVAPFSAYVCLSAATMSSANPIGATPKCSTVAGLISLQSLVSILCFAVLLQRLIQLASDVQRSRARIN